MRYPNGFGQAITDGVTQALAKLSATIMACCAHLVEGLSLRKLAHIRGVNVNAVARDYASMRAAIQDQIHQALSSRSGLPPEDVTAVLGALFTRVNLGITATLRSLRGPAPTHR